MTSQKGITLNEISYQSVYDTDHWHVLLPESPVSPTHMLIVVRRDDATVFTSLINTELIDLRTVIDFLNTSLKYNGYNLIGYNLFSNNGEYRIGQHLDRFHQHIFIRERNEAESPYTAMADGRRWTTLNSKEWINQRDKLRTIFNSIS